MRFYPKNQSFLINPYHDITVLRPQTRSNLEKNFHHWCHMYRSIYGFLFRSKLRAIDSHSSEPLNQRDHLESYHDRVYLVHGSYSRQPLLGIRERAATSRQLLQFFSSQNTNIDLHLLWPS